MGWKEETLPGIGLATSVCSLENRNLLVPRCLRQDAGPEMNKPESLIWRAYGLLGAWKGGGGG